MRPVFISIAGSALTVLAAALSTAPARASEPPVAAAPTPQAAAQAPAAPAALTDPRALLAQRIDMARLEERSPGWNLTKATGDEHSGSLTIERVIWPVFYLHWRSFERAGAGPGFGPKEAQEFVRNLWEEPSLDALGEPSPIALPSHPAYRMEAATGQGIRSTRYVVWACPESGRLFAADMNIDLRTASPLSLLEWQEEMVRTVKCHPEARTESSPRLRKTHDLADLGVSVSHPETWAPIEGYRVQKSLEGTEFSALRPLATREEGKEMILVADSIRRLYLEWAPEPDQPMDYFVLQERLQKHWRENAADILEGKRRVSNNVWIMDGIARPGPVYRKEFPVAIRNKYRGWMWRKNGMAYFAVGDVAAVRVGRFGVNLTFDEWDLNLEQLFQSILW